MKKEEIINNPNWVVVDRDQLANDPKSVIQQIFTKEVYDNDFSVNEMEEDVVPPYQEWFNSATASTGTYCGHKRIFVSLQKTPKSWELETPIRVAPGCVRHHKYFDPFEGHHIHFELEEVDGCTYVNKQYFVE